MKNKILSKEQAIGIINWYDSKNPNWGSWGNYPTLPVGASYLQYDIVDCVIKLKEPLSLNDGENECFKFITSGHYNTPGVKKGSDYITFYDLKAWAMPEVVKAEYELQSLKRKAAYTQAITNFKSLPVQIQTELLAMTREAFGSNNIRKSAIYIYCHKNRDVIEPIMTTKDVRQIVDCIQNNNKYFSI